jgi:hypothetical protein
MSSTNNYNVIINQTVNFHYQGNKEYYIDSNAYSHHHGPIVYIAHYMSVTYYLTYN